MAKLLGTPYKRGQSDIIVAFDRPTTDIEEGLAVIQTGVTSYEKYAGTGTVCGVMGGTEHKGASAVRSGLEVYVQIPDTVTTITAGTPVYVDANGKFTNVSAGNTQVNASFVDGVIATDGRVQTGTAKRENQKCALINIFGGM